jgi:hypothetical protein
MVSKHANQKPGIMAYKMDKLLLKFSILEVNNFINFMLILDQNLN